MKDLDAQGIAVIIAAIIAGFGSIMGIFFRQMNKQESRNNKILGGFMKAVSENTKSNQKVANATERAANEARERNGHLAELTLGNREFLDKSLQQMKVKIKLNEECKESK